MKKRLLSAAAVLISASMITVPSFADDDDKVNVYVSITKGDPVVTARSISVGDTDGDEEITVKDVLYTAHKLFFSGGASGFSSKTDEDDVIYITKLWGVSASAYGCYLNNYSVDSLDETVSDDDYVDAFVFSDKSKLSDVYCYFSENVVEAAAGEEISLVLTGSFYDDEKELTEDYIDGAEILVDGRSIGVRTDSSGEAVFSLDNTGTFVISASSASRKLVSHVCTAVISGSDEDDGEDGEDDEDDEDDEDEEPDEDDDDDGDEDGDLDDNDPDDNDPDDSGSSGDNDPDDSGYTEDGGDEREEGSGGSKKPDTGLSGWDLIISMINKSSAGETIYADMNGAAVIPEKVISAMKGKDVYLKLKMSEFTAWRLHGTLINTPKDIDLRVTYGKDLIAPELIDAIKNKSGYAQFSLAQSGDLGLTINLEILLGTEFSGKYANLFSCASDGRSLSYTGSDVIRNGKASLPLTHASEWIVTISSAAYTGSAQIYMPGAQAEESEKPDGGVSLDEDGEYITIGDGTGSSGGSPGMFSDDTTDDDDDEDQANPHTGAGLLLIIPAAAGASVLLVKGQKRRRGRR